MRFTLVKNFCPSCGGTLLSELDSHEIGVINKRLQSQEFMIALSDQLNKDLVQNLIYDLSIFIKFDLKKEMGLSAVSAKVAEEAHITPESDTSNEQVGSEPEEDDDRTRIPSKRIARISAIADRQQPGVSARSLRRMSYDNEPEDEYSEDEDDSSEDSDEGLDDRVKRLKQIYNTSPTLKKFQGITRSDDI